MGPEPTTLPELLSSRVRHNTTGAVHFLDENGNVSDTLSFRDLFLAAKGIAESLLSHGLRGGGEDIVVTNFSDQKTHVLLFWGCCLARIPICPTPPFHPDPSRHSTFLLHLNDLFHHPVFIARQEGLDLVEQHVPTSRRLDVEVVLASAKRPPSDWHLEAPQPSPPSNETVALMLTSGSTGNSKGVVLTHSTMLSAIRGKSIKHETTDRDAFLNWINFDHVANVTEAHLQAIWAGASQYQVSPSAVLKKPRNLLDWCSRYRITYTFSPNFLLGQICRDTSVNSPDARPDDLPDLSSLRTFISGGEANPMKTAIEFTDILERCGTARTVLRAGFGMTETCAGSIYNADPIPKSISDAGKEVYLSLGTPCLGLSMRVVDPDTCLSVPPNTPGQLQLSGTSVFPRYYANEAATKSSFAEDGWFITGDLALIDERGKLHMLGRSKDDINVNGVKHPSVDIEHHIEGSNIDGVLISFVLVSAVRPAGADTESYAVFYKHATIDAGAIVDGTLDDATGEELLATNKGIRTACSIFCSQAPLTVLPLPAPYFVKTALGKVSRSTLAKSYEQGKFKAIEEYFQDLSSKQSSPSSGQPLTKVDEALMEAVSTTFEIDISTADFSLNLFDAGATSMHLVRLKHRIREALKIHVPTIEFLKRPVLQDLSTYIHQCLEQGAYSETTSYKPLVCFQPSGSKPPLFLIHPGVGEVLVFMNLARILDNDRPIFALRARGFEGNEVPPSSMDEMVRIYSECIQKENPMGPYLIAGYSFGGVVAVEVAKALERQGKEVIWVGILNIPPFIQFRIRELIWSETFINLLMFLALVTQDDFEAFKAALLETFSSAISQSEPANADEIISWAFKRSDRKRLAELRISESEFRRWANVAYCVSATGQTYEPSGAVSKALTTVFCATPLPAMGTREEYKRERLSRWKDYSGPHFEMVDVDGEHYTMLSEENYQSFASHMRSAIQRAESLRSPRKVEVDTDPQDSATSISAPRKGLLSRIFSSVRLILSAFGSL